MDDLLLQTRDVRGAQVRAQVRDADVLKILRNAKLPPAQRTVLLEYVSSAIVADGREDLGGARYLSRAAAEMPDLPNLRETVRKLATAFVGAEL
jgi:hypothetical protein